MALIRQESSFDPHAISSAGAVGLMQVLPKTAAGRRRKVRTARRRLLNAAYNIRMGCIFLREWLKQFDANLEEGLAAYNAGDGRVREWLSWQPYAEPAEFVETVPIEETRAYVQTVVRDAEVYRELLTGKVEFARCGAAKQALPRRAPAKPAARPRRRTSAR